MYNRPYISIICSIYCNYMSAKLFKFIRFSRVYVTFRLNDKNDILYEENLILFQETGGCEYDFYTLIENCSALQITLTSHRPKFYRRL